MSVKLSGNQEKELYLTPGGKYTHHRGLYFGFNRISYGDGLTCDVWHCKAPAFQNHEKETREHLTRLKQIFTILGETPEPTVCHATEGLKKEHEALHEVENT